MPIPKFTFLKDEPKTKQSGNFFNFYHDTIAPALKKVLRNKSSPHTIGLFGSWGTGKSTVIEILRNDIGETIPFFVFDAWKYQNDSLRRIFLLKLKDFIDSVDSECLPPDILDSVYNSSTKSTTAEVPINLNLKWQQQAWRFIKANAVAILMLIALIVWACLHVFAKNSQITQALTHIAGGIASVSFAAVVFKPVIEKVLGDSIAGLLKSSRKVSEVQTVTEQRDRLNSPEEFEEKFNQIVGHFDKKMVIVVDNIDRVPGDIAISMLSTIKTFMDPVGGKGIVFIIPCDAEAIVSQIEHFYSQHDSIQGSHLPKGFKPSDYLRKVFNLVIWMPEFVSTDLEEYTKKCLAETGEISNLLNDDDVVLVINAAFSSNPREIIQFINNLVAVALTVQYTKVKETINENIAYLAKVLILKQVFPDAYQRLKKQWYQPEGIVGENDSVDIKDFMSLTSRITTSNAEPFIYFKDPTGSRNLSRPAELSASLVGGNETFATELIRSERDKDAVADFIVDSVIKYASQQSVLLNVFKTQFVALANAEVEVNKPRYYESLTKVLDSQLWAKYRELPTDIVFELITNQLTPSKLRKAIIDRYILTLAGENDDEARRRFNRKTIGNLVKYRELLNGTQRNDLMASIENKFTSDDDVMSLFSTPELQQQFVTPKALDQYVTSIDYANIAVRILAMRSYKQYLLDNEQVGPLISQFATILASANAEEVSLTSKKKIIIDQIGTLVIRFRDALKPHEDALMALSTALNTTYQNVPNWIDKASAIKAMWWLDHYVPSQASTDFASQINAFFTSADVESIKYVLSNWSESTVQNFINTGLNAFYPRIVNDNDLRTYLYDRSSSATKSNILAYLFRNTPDGQTNDLTFLEQLSSNFERESTINLLLEKTDRLAVVYRKPYYDFIAPRIAIGDSREIKDRIVSQATSLVNNDDQTTAQLGYDFITGIGRLGIADLTSIVTSAKNWLCQPGKVIQASNRFTLLLVSQNYKRLSMDDRREYVEMLLDRMRTDRDIPSLEVIFEQLKLVAQPLNTFATSLSSLQASLESSPDQESRAYIIQELASMKPRRPGSGERPFWRYISP